ncbi:hypothetical protein [Ruminococcus sp.]|uniref:hypothetical protein n=1 Tax=Ruminococcus sp. TaxID=41978 RepID=UPI002BF9758A|nr:hypothetical protein [Ruminococcus sp.]HNZ98806.1 hypothetical protein [Ruminococcus sp.]
MMMKNCLRLLSTAAAGIIAFTMLPKLPDKVADAAGNDRYTVLVLDASGSMWGTPAAKQRGRSEILL